MFEDPVKLSPEQAGRDLTWAITSCPLIDCQSMPAWTLSASDFDIDELAAFINERFTIPVGRYFELLIQFYLQRCLKVELLAHGQQIQVDGRTVGELDFVFRNPSVPATVHHVETAVKYYLHFSSDDPSGSHFIGPNPADNFESKLARLQNHQLPMSIQHAPEVTDRLPFVKGIIFYRPDETRPQQLPAGMAVNHCSGMWLRSNELDLLDSLAEGPESELRFTQRQKPLWLSNNQLPPEHANLLTIQEMQTELATHFAAGGKPRMLSVMQNSQAGYQELQRLFIVDEDWPAATVKPNSSQSVAR